MASGSPAQRATMPWAIRSSAREISCSSNTISCDGGGVISRNGKKWILTGPPASGYGGRPWRRSRGFLVQTYRCAGHSARTLGDGQQGVNTVQRPPGTGTPMTGREQLMTTTPGRGGGKAGYSQDNGLFPAGFQVPQEFDEFRKVAVGGQNRFFIRDPFLCEIFAAGSIKGLSFGLP